MEVRLILTSVRTEGGEFIIVNIHKMSVFAVMSVSVLLFFKFFFDFVIMRTAAENLS